MQHDLHIEEKLWDWLDGQCSDAEQKALQQLVNTEPAWKARYDELQQLHLSLQHDMELMDPSMRFAKNVMEQIALRSLHTTAKNYLNNKIIYTIGGLFVTFLVGVVVYAFAMVDWASGNKSNTSLPVVDFSKLDFSNLLSGPYGSLGMMVIVVLAMVLFDKYLSQRKNRSSKISA